MSTEMNTERQLAITALSDVKVQSVRYLWPPYVPIGKVTLLEGDPESGKTFIGVDLAARVTQGNFVEGLVVQGERREPANVLYLTAEDDLADTIKPRLLKQGGDDARFLASKLTVEHRDGKKYYRSLQLSDIAEFDRTFRQHHPALMVVDPYQAFLGAKVDMHRANEIRPVLSGLADLAERHKCAILLIRHLNKGQGKALYRGMGSIDTSAAARSILLAGKHPDDPTSFVLIQEKSSLGCKGPSLTYQIGDEGLVWKGTSDITAEELLNPRQPAHGPRNEAKDFLRKFLGDGPKLQTEILAAGSKVGISASTLRLALKDLGGVCKPTGYQKPWVWELPIIPAEDPAVCSTASNGIEAEDPGGCPTSSTEGQSAGVNSLEEQSL